MDDTPTLKGRPLPWVGVGALVFLGMLVFLFASFTVTAFEDPTAPLLVALALAGGSLYAIGSTHGARAGKAALLGFVVPLAAALLLLGLVVFLVLRAL